MEMTDSCNQEHERSGDVSSSDDDSASLLCDRKACPSRGAADAVEITDLDSHFGNSEQKKKVVMELKPPEPEISSCALLSAAGRADSTSQSAAKVSRCVKIPKTKLNKKNGKGETPLHKACRRVDVELVRGLIQAGICVNIKDNAGWTALHEASAVGGAAVVEELLKAGANVNARSFNGVTPLHDAVCCGHYQVVKLLLQYGSNPGDRNVGGLSALDMAEEEAIKELLSLRVSSLVHEQPCEAPAQHRRPGGTSTEASSRAALSCQSAARLGCRDTAYGEPGESGDGDGAREPGDIQLSRKDTTADNISHSEAMRVVLEEVGRKQTEISTWPLTAPEDTGRYHTALTQIQDVMIDVLAKQRLAKDHPAQKYRTAPKSLWRRVFRSHIVTLASRQRTIMEILHKQMELEAMYVTMKAKLSTQPLNHRGSTGVRRESDHFSNPASAPASSKARDAHSCDQKGQRRESQRSVKRTSLFQSTPPNYAKYLTKRRPPAPLLTQTMKAATHADVPKKKASSRQSSAPRPGNTSQHISFQMKGSNALIQTQAEDNSMHLSQLIQRGVMPPGSALQLFIEGRWHLAHVLGDGSIRDSKGKSHRAPERWLESILGNNIPVGSTYTWDKVMFRGKPLSHYVLNTEAAGNEPQTGAADDVQHEAGSSQEELTAEASLKRLMNIKIIHLVGDDEMLPNAVMDYYWEKLLKKDYSESEEWGNEF